MSKAMPKRYDLAGNIIAHEAGELTESRTLHLFSHLVRTGLAWTLQGSYGRAAASLIDNGYLDHGGKILKTVGE